MVATKKRSASTKKTVAKRPVAKKAASRPRATAVRVSRKAQLKSLKLAPQETPFMSYTPTIQTLYWTAIGIIAIVFTTWIMTLQSQIHAIYDSIDYNTATSTIVDTKKK